MDAPVEGASILDNVAYLHALTQEEDWYIPQFQNRQNIENMCRSIQEEIQKLDWVDRVYPTYKVLDEHRKLVFVICTDLNSEMNKTDLPLAYQNLNVIFRNANNQSDENDYVVSSSDYRDSDASQSNASNKSLIDQSTRLLANHSNLMSIVTSPIKSTGYGKPDAKLVTVPCIVLFVTAKGYVPLYEDMCPERIHSFRTDVREGQLQLYGHHQAKEYHHTLRMGCAISGGKQHQGTIGVFVHDNEKTYFITSAHVLLSETAYKYLLSNGTIEGLILTDDDKVYQPSSVETSRTGKPIGIITKAVYRLGYYLDAGVEAVLVELTDRNRYPTAGNFPDGDFEDNGFTAEAPMTFNSGETVNRTQFSLSRTEVLKFGSETGITQGLFRLAGKSVHRVIFRDNSQVVLYSQLQVLSMCDCPFAAPGDSGALVVIPHQGKETDLKALGIVTGGIGKNICCVTPIWDILEAFDSNLELIDFRTKPFSP